MERFKLGKIVSAVGLKGEFRVYPYTDHKERFEELDAAMIGDIFYPIERVRYSGQLAVLKVKGIEDRTAAEKLRGRFIEIDRKDARKLPEDTYYIADLVGLRAVDEDGGAIGTLAGVIQNPAQDIYEIETVEGRIILVPAVEAFVRHIDLNAGVIVLHLIDGMR